MSALGDTLRDLAAVLDDRGLEWFVFGAQAVAVRGAPRATQDIDVTVHIDRAVWRDLLADLEAKGFHHRYPDDVGELVRTGSVLPLVHEASRMETDLVIAGSGLETLAAERATRVSIDGVVVPVAHATDLVAMKVLAGRGKDLDDVRSMLASGDVDVEEARDLLLQMERALGRPDLVTVLDAAVREIES